MLGNDADSICSINQSYADEAGILGRHTDGESGIGVLRLALQPQLHDILYLLVSRDVEILHGDVEGLLCTGKVEGCYVDATVRAERKEALSMVFVLVVLFMAIQGAETTTNACHCVYVGVQQALFGACPAKIVAAASALVAGAEVICYKHHTCYGSTGNTGAILANSGFTLIAIADKDQMVGVVELIKAVCPPSSADGIHCILRLVYASPGVTGDAPSVGMAVGKERSDGEV